MRYFRPNPYQLDILKTLIRGRKKSVYPQGMEGTTLGGLYALSHMAKFRSANGLFICSSDEMLRITFHLLPNLNFPTIDGFYPRNNSLGYPEFYCGYGAVLLLPFSGVKFIAGADFDYVFCNPILEGSIEDSAAFQRVIQKSKGSYIYS